jgi:hypothetical protein
MEKCVSWGWAKERIMVNSFKKTTLKPSDFILIDAADSAGA